MTRNPANPICGGVGIAQKAAVELSGWGLVRAGGGLGAEEVPAGTGSAERAPLVPFGLPSVEAVLAAVPVVAR